jgi:branched-chain amino acid aminotransferase
MTHSSNPFAPKPDLKVFLDGEIVPVADAKISVFDHGLLYGDGVFEGIRVYGGKVFECGAHLRRLFDSAKAIRLDIPMTAGQIEKALYDTIAANHIVDGYIRLVVTRGVGYLGLAVTRTACPSVFVIADQIELYPKEMYEKGMEVITSTVIRNHPNALSPRVKSLNYLNNILAKIEAIDAGVPEAIMFNHEGLVSECTGDNLFLVRDGELQTPPTSAGILEGVTRDVVIRLAKRGEIPLEEKNLTRHDLYIADECFLTGTAAELISVTKVDGRTIGDGVPGPITMRLLEAFHQYCRNHGA